MHYYWNNEVVAFHVLCIHAIAGLRKLVNPATNNAVVTIMTNNIGVSLLEELQYLQMYIICVPVYDYIHIF